MPGYGIVIKKFCPGPIIIEVILPWKGPEILLCVETEVSVIIYVQNFLQPKNNFILPLLAFFDKEV